ncbi:hypothetical protein [Kitasatospora sp. NPDC094015]|uniref:hypothetical protein n=1 Tax=Kitasatospora sp. NPDC094015 TaxID=3155205 RepID=UPI00331F939C
MVSMAGDGAETGARGPDEPDRSDDGPGAEDRALERRVQHHLAQGADGSPSEAEQHAQEPPD